MRLENKVAIITGAARGMGAEDARLFGREGASVVVAATGSGNTITQPTSVTDDNGQTTASLTSTDPGTKTISAQVSSVPIEDTAVVIFEDIAQVSLIGGAIYEDPSSPLTSGLEGVTVAVSGANGTYAGTTSSGTGLWQIADVNEGAYTVTPSKSGWSFEHIVAGVPDGKASITITVNEANLAANQSIQFLAERSVLHDWNGDGIVSIIGDVPPFVNCVYFQNCPDVPGNQLLSIGDCNGDGILSIIGDVPCFVDCVYFGNCPE